jgi:hypothetical protein
LHSKASSENNKAKEIMSEIGLPEQVHSENTNRDNDCLKTALETKSNSNNGVLRDEKHKKKVTELTKTGTTNGQRSKV